MARPSKLSDHQWAEIERRSLNGETPQILAKAFGVGVQTIRDRVSVRNRVVKDIAHQLVNVEQQIEQLPVSVQVSVRTLADKLKGISDHAASAAELGMMTAHRLAQIANQHANTLDDVSPDVEVQSTIMRLNTVAKEAAHIGLNLLAANKETIVQINQVEQKKEKILTRDEFYGRNPAK